MSLYDIDYTQLVNNLIPQTRRKTRFVSWLYALLTPQKYVSDIFFNEYTNGSSAPFYSGFVSLYPKGSRVNFYGAIYEAKINVSSGHYPTDTNYWTQITSDFRGVNERVRYSSQKITLEYVLNHWYNTNWLQPDDVDNQIGRAHV